MLPCFQVGILLRCQRGAFHIFSDANLPQDMSSIPCPSNGVCLKLFTPFMFTECSVDDYKTQLGRFAHCCCSWWSSHEVKVAQLIVEADSGSHRQADEEFTRTFKTRASCPINKQFTYNALAQWQQRETSKQEPLSNTREKSGLTALNAFVHSKFQENKLNMQELKVLQWLREQLRSCWENKKY